jgi:hypothetical protein
MKTLVLHWLALALITGAGMNMAFAQSNGLPSASRTVFKCMVDGKVTYSDSPCLGAQRLDIVPSRGMNKSTGRELSGADVNRERHSEMMSEALRPLTGMNNEEHAKATRRYRLSQQAQLQCRGLEQQIAMDEAQGQKARGADNVLQQRLLKSRTRFREIGC